MNSSSMLIPDIANLSVALSTALVQNEFSTAVLSDVLDTSKNVNNVLEGAVATIPGLGENIDVSV